MTAGWQRPRLHEEIEVIAATDSHAAEVAFPIRMRHAPHPGVQVCFGFSADTAELQSVTIERAPDGPALTRTLISDLPLTLMERAARRAAFDFERAYARSRPPGVVAYEMEMLRHRRPGEPDPRPPIARFGSALEAAEETNKPVRSGRWYAELAAAYVEAVNRVGTAYASELSRRFSYTPASIRTAVSQARKLGYLTETVRGRPGGVLTAKARALLEGSEV
jgi:hypothetical protein